MRGRAGRAGVDRRLSNNSGRTEEIGQKEVKLNGFLGALWSGFKKSPKIAKDGTVWPFSRQWRARTTHTGATTTL